MMATRCSTVEACRKMLEAERRRSKYRNLRTPYNGRTYDSQAEAAYAYQLDLRVRAGDIRSWRPQVRTPIAVNGRRICVYVLDFEITHMDGSAELVELKGPQTKVWKLKRRLFEVVYLTDHPEVQYTVVML